MKDTSHHLKSIQKKVIQSARKETRVRWKNSAHNNNNVNYLAVSPNSKVMPKSV